MKKIFILITLLISYSCTNNYESCDIEIIDDLVYNNKILYTGKCAFFDDSSGKIISSHEYNNGKFHGKWKFYFPNGQLETVGKFNNGLRVGKWNYYNENGKKKQISRYSNGKKDGIWKVFDENGQLIFEQEWKDGSAVKDSTMQNNKPFDIKIEGYDVKPLYVNPNSD